MSELALRPLMPEDGAPVRAVLDGVYAGTPHESRMRELLDIALAFEDPEYIAVLAFEGDVIRGVAIFGTVAGASRCSKIHTLAGDAEAMRALASGVGALCLESGERLVVAELADDATLEPAATALLAEGFTEEARVPDFVSDGVALRILSLRS